MSDRSHLPPIEVRLSSGSLTLLPRAAVQQDGEVRPQAAVVSGLAIPTNAPSQPIPTHQVQHDGPSRRTPGRLGWFREVIAPEALDDVVAGRGPDLKFLIQHDRGRVMGRRSAGTLQVERQSDGLWFTLQPPSGPAGVDFLEAVRRRDLQSMSFAYAVLDNGDHFTVEDRGERDADGQPMPTRVIRKMKLFELSAVDEASFASTLLQVDERLAERAAACYLQWTNTARWRRLRHAELTVRHLLTDA